MTSASSASPATVGTPSMAAASPPRPGAPVTPAAEAYVPGLTSPGLFSPLPRNDPLSGLIDHHFPPEVKAARRARLGRNASVQAMVDAGAWMALAEHARSAIIAAPADATSMILDLWILRFQALHLLRLGDSLAVEIGGLFSLLPPPLRIVDGATGSAFEPTIPFALLVLRAQAFALIGEPESAFEALYELALWTAADDEERAVWQRRTVDVATVTAAILIEMRSHAHAQAILASLPPSDSVLSAQALAAIRAGDTAAAYDCLQRQTTVDREVHVIERLATGRYGEARDAAKGAALGVAHVYAGDLAAGIATMRELDGPLAEPIVANLATLLELHSTRSFGKVDLLAAVVTRAVDGLDPACLKMSV